MPLGPAVPEWAALVRSLAALTERAAATNAFVTDAWGHLWCRAWSPDSPHEVLALARRVADSAAKPLERGGHLGRGAVDAQGAWYARSFAGVYIVLIVFDGAFDVALVRAALGESLPTIEALTLALPPPDGPETGAAAAELRG